MARPGALRPMFPNFPPPRTAKPPWGVLFSLNLVIPAKLQPAKVDAAAPRDGGILVFVLLAVLRLLLNRLAGAAAAVPLLVGDGAELGGVV